jgi:predicted lipase
MTHASESINHSCLLTRARTAASRIEEKHSPLHYASIIGAATAAVAKQYRAENRIDITLAPMSEMSHC